MNKYLAGDIGGTKVRLSIFEKERDELVCRTTRRFSSHAYPGFLSLLQEFMELEGFPKVDAACFGAPGPAANGQIKATNLPWDLCENHISTTFGIPKVRLVNDLYSTAAAIPFFPAHKIQNLYAGTPCHEPERRAVIVAPGTGLGQAFLKTENNHLWICPSEGGHSDLAPTNPLEVELFQYLNREYEHVSYERVLSGPGLVNVYMFLRDCGYGEEPDELKARLEKEDKAAVIGSTGLKGEFRLCSKALDLFVSLLGSHAGNLALTFSVNDAVYLGGGIPPKIIEKLRDGRMVKSFLNKGRLSESVSGTAINVILDDHAAIFGAAHLAARL